MNTSEFVFYNKLRICLKYAKICLKYAHLKYAAPVLKNKNRPRKTRCVRPLNRSYSCFWGLFYE